MAKKRLTKKVNLSFSFLILFSLWLNFINVLLAAFAPVGLHQQNTNLKCRHKKAAGATYVRKSCAKNVGEIDPMSPHLFSSMFYRQLMGQ
jgi:hypothetical protein